MPAIGWKVLNTAGNVVAGKAAKKATAKSWVAATGAAPKSKSDPLASTTELLIYAAFSAAISAGIKAFVEQKTVHYYTKTTGHVPPHIAKARAQAADKAEARKRLAG